MTALATFRLVVVTILSLLVSPLATQRRVKLLCRILQTQCELSQVRSNQTFEITQSNGQRINQTDHGCSHNYDMQPSRQFYHRLEF